MAAAGYISSNDVNNDGQYTPDAVLSKKDEKDIAKRIEDLKNDLN